MISCQLNSSSSLFSIPSLLKSLSSDPRAMSHGQAKAIHALAIKTRLDSHVYVVNNLLKLYANCCRDIFSARMLFDRFPQRDLITWTILIRGYTKMGFPKEAIRMFFQMVDAGDEPNPDEVTLTVVLSACASLGDLQLGRELHSYIDNNNLKPDDIHIRNALITMYTKCGDLGTAQKLLRKIPLAERNIVTWNSIISGLSSNGEFKEALSLFRRMQRSGVKPDEVTLVAALNACANLGLLDMGLWIHALIIIITSQTLSINRFIRNALVDMYAKCGSIDRAQRVFSAIQRKDRDVYTYTSMIIGLAMHGQGEKALDLFADMSAAGIKPNQITFIGVLSACSHSGLVAAGLRHFQDMSSIYKITPQMEHYGCIVDMLGRAGMLKEAFRFIHRMPFKPDAQTWSALLGACRIHGNVSLSEIVMKQLHHDHVELADDEEAGDFICHDHYVLMSNIYSAANRRRDATRLRVEMRKRKAKKKPGCSLIEINGVVCEFRMGDRSHPQTQEIHLMLHVMASHVNSL